MDSRAQFEEWMKKTGQNPPYAIKRGLWEVWKASRAAIEVELPAYRDATTHGFSAFNDALDICENEMRKKGISIKDEVPLQHEAKEE